MHDSRADFDTWKKEKKLLDELKEIKPEFFISPKSRGRDVFEHIGIFGKNEDLPEGYLKYLPTDFIVEEIDKDGGVITIESNDYNKESFLGETIYADMVKTGISTIDAIDRIAVFLKCEKKQISYAGIKDAGAVTSQRVSFRGLTVQKFENFSVEQVFLKNFFIGKGVTNIGDLKGNRFTILIRCKNDINKDFILKKIEHINKNGIYNYYGQQRFGTPRLMSHLLGKRVLQGDLEGLVKMILVGQSEFEWPLLSTLRKNSEKVYGDWKEMDKIFEKLPYMFRLERQILSRLMSWHGKGSIWFFAIAGIPEQIDFWAKSYASYLANKLLSISENENVPLPDKIPLLLNTTANVEEYYGAFLNVDKTNNFKKNIEKNPFVKRGENSFLETKVFPEIHAVKFTDEGLSISFDLPKGAYATTLINEIFSIQQEWEKLDWLSNKYVDTKKVLGLGSMDDIKDWVIQYINVPFQK